MKLHKVEKVHVKIVTSTEDTVKCQYGWKSLRREIDIPRKRR
jgi:hypothetical protein